MGMEWEDVHFTGYINGKPVAQQHMVANPLPTSLQVEADADTLRAGERDTVRVIVRALDQAGSRLAFLNEAITVKIDGPGKVLGPQTVAFQGGTTGFWLQATGKSGTINLEVSSPRFASQSLSFTAR